MLKATLHESITSVDRAGWDELGTDPFSSHAVLAALEQAALPGIRMWYATIEDENGRTLAAAPIARIEVDAERLAHGLFRRLIRAVRKLYPAFLRTALTVCGTPLSVGNPPVRIARGLDSAPILQQLARLLQELGKREGAPWLAFKEIASDELEDARRALPGTGRCGLSRLASRTARYASSGPATTNTSAVCGATTATGSVQRRVRWRARV